MNKQILKFILLFKPLFERFGVDPEQLQVILMVKLTMDDRRPYTQMGRGKQKKEHKHSSWLAMLFLALMGTFMIFFLSLENILLGHTFYLGMFMVMMALTLVSDFTSVLIDVRDNYIILPRPVSDRTFTVSRILHVSIHVLKLMIGLSFPGLLYIIFTQGLIGMAAFVIEVLSATLFCIFLVNMIYLTVLKFTTAERFKNFISYFQIIISVFIFGVYQIFPRLMSNMSFIQIDLLSHRWTYLLPPVWFASFFSVIVEPHLFTITRLALGITGLAVPFISVFLVVKYLAPGFNRKLSAISGSGNDNASPAKPSKDTAKGGSLAQKLSVFLSKDPVEQAGFKLTWWLTSRYRDFKVKVYPSFAYVPVYFVYFMFLKGSKSASMSERMQELQNGAGYIFLPYLTAFVILTVLQQITQSEKYKAAWVMFSTPHNKPGRILSGMYKAVICKYFIPYYVVIAIYSLYVWGVPAINDLLLGFFNILNYGILLALITVKYLPFSQPAVVESGKIYSRLLVMFLIFLFGFGHYAIIRWEWAVDICAVISAGICLVLFNYFQKRDWEAMEADYG